MTHGISGYTQGCRCDVCRAGASAYYREWRSTRRKELAAKARDYYASHTPEQRERHNARQRARSRSQTFRDRKNAYMREWRRRNPERARAATKRHLDTDQRREWMRLYQQKRRARNLGVIDREVAKLLLATPCSYCGGSGGEIDHIVPITKDGTHDSSNLTSACRICNRRKHNKTLLTFLAEGGMRREVA